MNKQFLKKILSFSSSPTKKYHDNNKGICYQVKNNIAYLIATDRSILIRVNIGAIDSENITRVFSHKVIQEICNSESDNIITALHNRAMWDSPPLIDFVNVDHLLGCGAEYVNTYAIFAAKIQKELKEYPLMGLAFNMKTGVFINEQSVLLTPDPENYIIIHKRYWQKICDIYKYYGEELTLRFKHDLAPMYINENDIEIMVMAMSKPWKY